MSNGNPSKWQRELHKTVKGLTNRPFTISTSGGNHLKILIEGISRPIFTSSTPGDHRAQLNIISEINKLLKAENLENMIAEEEVELMKDTAEQTQPAVPSTLIQEIAEAKATLQESIKEIMGLSKKERVIVLGVLSISALEDLEGDIKDVRDSKHDEAVLSAVEIMQSAGVTLEEVAELLGKPEPTPGPEPKPEVKDSNLKIVTSKARERCRQWMAKEVTKNPDVTPAHFTKGWEEEMEGYKMPHYQTVYAWLSAVKANPAKWLA